MCTIWPQKWLFMKSPIYLLYKWSVLFRQVLERACALPLGVHKLRSLFRKWMEAEQRFGDDKSRLLVRSFRFTFLSLRSVDRCVLGKCYARLWGMPTVILNVEHSECYRASIARDRFFPTTKMNTPFPNSSNKCAFHVTCRDVAVCASQNSQHDYFDLRFLWDPLLEVIKHGHVY